MKEVLNNIIINSSNILLFVTNLILIKALKAEEIALYYYTLAVYNILSIISSLYSSKAYREYIIKNYPDSNIPKVFSAIVILSILINTLLLILTNIPLYLFINFTLWNVIDYFNNFLFIKNDPKRTTSILLPRFIRTIIAFYLFFNQSLTLESFSILNSILAMIVFLIINLNRINFTSPYIPEINKNNLGFFIADIANTISSNFDNIALKNIKAFPDSVFSIINYTTINMKYLSGVFHSITLPLLLISIKNKNNLSIKLALLHLILPLILYFISSIALWFIFIFLNIPIIETYWLIIIGYGINNIVNFFRTILIVLDYKKPLLIGEFFNIIISIIFLILLIDVEDPYNSFSNYVLFWSSLSFIIYLFIFFKSGFKYIQL